jgi:predicted N-acetyltransferase YhbS
LGVAATSEWEIRPERPEDAGAVEALVARVFGPGRFAKSAYRLREGVDPVAELSLVAIDQNILRGSVRFWPIYVGAEPALLLGPLSAAAVSASR